MRTAESRTFLVQALRYLGTFQAHVSRRDEAITHLEEARQIAQRDEILGQLNQIESELRALRALSWR